MSATSSQSSTSASTRQSNLKSGTLYKKISLFLGNNPATDTDASVIQSANTAINPYTNLKKRRYIDMLGGDLHPSLSNTISGRCYNKLRKLESSLDMRISQRHNYIATQLQQPNNTCYNHSVSRTLRFEVYNTFHVDPSGDSSLNKWNLKIQAKLLPTSQNDINTQNPFASVISRISLAFNGETVQWNNPRWPHHAQKNSSESSLGSESDKTLSVPDGIELERCGNRNCKVTMQVYLSHWCIPFETSPFSSSKSKRSTLHGNQNALCAISDSLATLLGLDSSLYHTKSKVLCGLGEYFRQNNLIRKDNSMAIDCDEALTRLVGLKTMYCGNLWKVLLMKRQVRAPEPLRIEHEICVSGDIKENATVYDMEVKVPSPVALEAAKLMEESVRKLYDVNEADEPDCYGLVVDAIGVKVSDVLEEIKDRKKENVMYEAYAKDPVSCMDVIVMNQRENLAIISEFVQHAGCKSSGYFQDCKQEMFADVKRYLKKKQLSEKRQTEQAEEKES